MTKTAAILLTAFLLLGAQAPRAAAQQSSSSSPSSQTQSPPPDDNSFPADISRKAAADKKKAEQQADKPGASSQDKPAADQNKPPAGPDDNAFPEETSRKAAADAKADNAKSDKESSSSDSEPSNSGVSSSSDYDNRTTGGRNAVPTNVPMPHVDGKDPVKEDLNVGGYYLESGNFAGAYLRFKDATTLAPENMDAIFGLAESARHLKRRDEALANYQLFLQVVSSGSKVKDARKAVAALEKIK